MTTKTVLKPEVKAFFDETTNTVSYIVKDPGSAACAIIDSVLDFDPAAGRTTMVSADAIIADVGSRKLQVEWIVETHVHADHLSAAPYLQEKLGGKIGICDKITIIQDVFGKIFNAGTEFQRDGSQFDRLFSDGDTFTIGGLGACVMSTPGHTPACMTWIIGDAAFVGDTLFMPDFGTARCDFPGGNAGLLYDSIQKLLSLPDDTILCMCHDYPPGSRSLRYDVTVREQKADNIHVGGGTGKDEFVKVRKARDEILDLPQLILPSIQVNIRAGHLPEPEDNEISYLKIPLDTL